MHILNTLPQRLDSGATPTFAGLLAGDGTAAAPSISFAAQTGTGFWRSANRLNVAINSVDLGGFSNAGGGSGDLFLSGTNANKLSLFNNGALSLVAAGTNQNITLTPSGTGEVSASSNIVLGVANNKLRSGVSNGYITPEDGTIGCVIYSAGGVDFRRNNGTQAMRLVGSNGNLLLGTTTDSGALLQIGTNTMTSAGGMVFGTDTFAYRTAAGRISFDSTSDPYLNIAKNGTIYGHWVSDASNVYFGSSTGISLTLRTNNTTALTLDASQNATFAKNVVARGALGYATGIHSGTTADSSQQFILSSSGAYSNAYVSKTGTTLGIGFSSSNTSFVEDNALSIVAATKAATFAGAVAIGGNATGGILRLGGTAPSADQAAEIFLTTSNTAFNWKVLTNTSGPGIFELRQSTAAGGTTFTDAILRITPNVTATSTTATFLGAVAIGNTTAAAVAAPSTHKVSILIGGVQYYLLASNV